MNQPKNTEEKRLRRVCFLILANNIKLISNKYKKQLKKIYVSIVYCSIEDYKLNSCSKKQTTVTPKNHSTLTATSEKLLEK